MNRKKFRRKVERGPLLLDGAMGTALHSKGIAIDQCFDAINLADPALVAAIHREYIDAGADIIETNSFGANRFKLDQHGHGNEVATINKEAVAIARQVIKESGKAVCLAGSVGPLGVHLAPLGRVQEREAASAFAEQVEALTADAGVDLLVLETMPDLRQLEAAVNAARSVSAEIPILGMVTFTRDDRTVLGDTPSDVAARLAQLDLDAIGVNCSSGPVQVLRLIATVRETAPNIPVAAVPNAGWPQQLEAGRVFYPATAEYFADYALAFVEAGVSLVGGCCGTTAEHIAAMRRALDSPAKGMGRSPRISRARRSGPAPVAADQPTQLDRALATGRFVATVEMSPPRGIAAQRLLAGARMLKEAGANFIDIADSPLARMRMSAWAAAHLLQSEVGLEAILHFPTRGRNLLRVQGDLLAAHALGIRNLFVVMGDPTQIGDYPEAMDNYDIVPSGLIRLIKRRLNSGVDQAGQTIDQPTTFTVGCALNLEPRDPAAEMRLLHKKIRNGADFIITQPVFNPEVVENLIANFQDKYQRPLVPIIAGVQPLYNSGNAEFLHNEVPGISIPDSIRERMRAAVDQQREGVTIAQEILEELESVVQGVYMIPVFGRYDLVADVMDVVADKL